MALREGVDMPALERERGGAGDRGRRKEGGRKKYKQTCMEFSTRQVYKIRQNKKQ